MVTGSGRRKKSATDFLSVADSPVDESQPGFFVGRRGYGRTVPHRVSSGDLGAPFHPMIADFIAPIAPRGRTAITSRIAMDNCATRALEDPAPRSPIALAR
jgi:hypothetical protein